MMVEIDQIAEQTLTICDFPFFRFLPILYVVLPLSLAQQIAKAIWKQFTHRIKGNAMILAVLE